MLDRVGLIIEIFGAHAETKEAKLQVDLLFTVILSMSLVVHDSIGD